MIIQVKLRKKNKNEYGGRAYSYESELFVREGDIVVVPTAKGLTYAQVVRTNVPREELDPAWAHHLREICDIAPNEDDDIDSIF